MTGFLEEAPGVKSSTRLIAVLLAICVAALVVALVVYLLRKAPSAPEAGVICAVGGVIITLVVHGCVAISRRNPDDPPPPVAP